MPLLGDERKKSIRAIKIGRSIEEVIVRRRFELDNQPVWPASSKNQKMTKPANSKELEGRDGGYSLLVGGPVGYKLSNDHEGNHRNSSNQQDAQRYEHFSSNDYNSMANYCQSLRFRVKVYTQPFFEHPSSGYTISSELWPLFRPYMDYDVKTEL